MAIVTSNETTVSMLTAEDDGTIRVRLTRSAGNERHVTLREPNAIEYAELRMQMRAVDKMLAETCTPPEAPDIEDGAADRAARHAVTEYAKAVAKWQDDRLDLIRDPEKPAYGVVFVEAIHRLGMDGAQDVGLEDLPPEALHVQACTALLETWEAPLGGPVVPPRPRPVLAVPDSAPQPSPLPDTPADSPEPAESSPPGTDTSTRSRPKP
jgi:hypothetical protein